MSLTSMPVRGRSAVRLRRLAVLGASVSALAVPAVASANPTNIDSGQAYGIKASVLGAKLTIGPDTGLIATNTSSSVSLNAGSLSTPFGSGSVFNTSVKTFGENAQAKASLAKARLTLPGLPVISGKLLTANSSASCHAHGTVLGSSVGGSITVGGTTYAVAAPANTTIPLGVGEIVLNQQVKTGNSLKVNAVHVEVPLLGIDVVVESAFSGVSNCA